MKGKTTDSQSTVRTNIRLRVVACCLCALGLGFSTASAATYTYTNTNVAGSSPASILDWLPGGPHAQGIWAGGTPVTNSGQTVIKFFQDATTSLGNTGAAGNCQTAYVNNAGVPFLLGTLTLQGRASDTPGANLALTLAGDKLNFGTAFSSSFYLNNDGACNGNQTLAYNVDNDIVVGSSSLSQTLQLWNTGPAALSLNGAISDLRAGGGALNKYGFGTVALTGNSSFSGGLTVYNGTIRLAGLNTSGTNLYLFNRGNAVFDLSAGNDRWNTNANISCYGGTLTVKGAPSGVSSQTFTGIVYVGYGQSKIVIDPNGGEGTTLTLGTLKSAGGIAGSLFVDLSAPGATLVSRIATGANGLIGWSSSSPLCVPIVKDTAHIDFGSTNSSGQVICYAGANTLLPTSNNANTNYVASGTLTMNAGAHALYSLKLDASSQPGFLDLNKTTLAPSASGGGMLMVGSNDYTVSNGFLTGSPWIQQYGSGTLTLDGIASNTITKCGPGRLALTGTNAFSGDLPIYDGVVQAVEGVGLPTNVVLRLIGGVFQSHGSMTRTCSGNNAGAGNVSWRPNNSGGNGGRGGGFAAQGGPLTVNLSTNDVNTNAVPNALLVWDGPWVIGFVGSGQALILGSTSSDSLLDWQNSIDFGSAKRLREIQVDDNPACSTDIAQMSGILSGTAGGLLKSGDGTLRLTAANTYAGPTVVNAGTLLVNGSLNAASEAVTIYGGTLGGTGTINRAVRVQPGATLKPGEDGAGTLAISGDVKICGTNRMTGTATLTCTTNCTLDAGVALSWDAGATGGITVNGVLTIPNAASVRFGSRLTTPLVLAQSANAIVGSPAAWSVSPASSVRVSLSADAKQILAMPADMGMVILIR